MNENNLSQHEIKGAESTSKKNFPWLLIIVVIVIAAIAFGAGIYVGRKMISSNETVDEDVGNKSGEEEIEKGLNDLNWSQMDQGPYQDKVSFAIGTSLLNWTDSQKILAEHASVPDVIYKEGTLYVYFVDVSENGKSEQIGLLRSKDKGQTWEEKQFVTISGLGKKVAVDPAPTLLADGRIRLYYFDIAPTQTEGTQNNTIYSAISSDGINFVEESGIRFKRNDIYDPDVIKMGDVWRMYVGTGNQQVLSAVSTDGLNFTYEGIALNGGAIPNVIYENDSYYLFTGGIEISTSTDGKTFTKTSNRFDCGGLTADPGVVKLENGSYFMVYKTKDESFQGQNNPPQN